MLCTTFHYIIHFWLQQTKLLIRRNGPRRSVMEVGPVLGQNWNVSCPMIRRTAVRRGGVAPHSNPLSLSLLQLKGNGEESDFEVVDKRVSICFLKQTYQASIPLKTVGMKNWEGQAELPADGSECVAHRQICDSTLYWRTVLEWRTSSRRCILRRLFCCCHIIAIVCSRDVCVCDNVGRPPWRKRDIPL